MRVLLVERHSIKRYYIYILWHGTISLPVWHPSRFKTWRRSCGNLQTKCRPKQVRCWPFRFLQGVMVPVLHLWYKCSKVNESICIIMLYPWNLVSSNPQNLDLMCHSVTWWVLLQESCASSWLPPWERRSSALGLETSNHSISSSEFYTKFEKEKHRETDTWYLQNFDLLLAQAHNHNQPEKIPWRQEFCIVRLEVLRQVQVQDAVGRVGYPTR